MIVLMPHIYEFQINKRPIAQMNFPFALSDNDIAGIKLTLANRENVHVEHVTHLFEWANLETLNLEPK